MNPQAGTPVERVHMLILNMLDTKDLDNKVFEHIYPWGETLASIAWAISDYYHRNIMASPPVKKSGQPQPVQFQVRLYRTSSATPICLQLCGDGIKRPG